MHHPDPEITVNPEADEATTGSIAPGQRAYPSRFPTPAEIDANGDEQDSSICRGYD
ncbi:hypothetical protein [Halopolyspora algeriensis]|nr:hypothetical protein [Halopolyspora algeriensis]